MKPTNTFAKLFSSVSTLAVVAGAMAFNGVAWGEGAVLAWGYNDYGQCTIPASANPQNPKTPVQIQQNLVVITDHSFGGQRHWQNSSRLIEPSPLASAIFIISSISSSLSFLPRFFIYYLNSGAGISPSLSLSSFLNSRIMSS